MLDCRNGAKRLRDTVCCSIALMASVLLYTLPPYVYAIDVGQPAPGFSLPALAGERVTLDAHAGKVRLINFWASWCEPCRHELPALDQLRRRYQQQEFEIIGISVDSSEDNARAFANRFPVDYPLAIDSSFEVAKAYHAMGMPTSYVVGRDGRIVAVITGFSPDKLRQIDAAVVTAIGTLQTSTVSSVP